MKVTAQAQQNRALTVGRKPSSLLGSVTPTSGIAIVMSVVGLCWVWTSNGQSYNYMLDPVVINRELRGMVETTISDVAEKTKLFDTYQNAEDMSRWRTSVENECRRHLHHEGTNSAGTKELLKKKYEIEKEGIERLSVPESASPKRPVDHKNYERCKNAFIDLGTNIGDSIGYFIDNSLDVCSPLWMKENPNQKINKDFPRPHIDVAHAKIFNDGLPKANPLFGMLQREMNKEGTNLRPESFCVYGMEGNPEFTDRLQKLENFVMDMRPRPVQHLNIHTESVVTAVDGPTKLYLDKTSVKENFWGSSILSSQQDAQKSAKELNNGEVFSADVDGVTLSSLVRNTMTPFDLRASEGDKEGGLLIIKMDVEGAEYQVIKEVASNGILCEYAKMGNRVYFIVEYHNMSITDAKERKREKAGHLEAKRKLEECGIEFGNLSANWH